MSEMVTLTIDGRSVAAPKGTLLVEAARQAGIEIPVFCYHPKLEPAGVCRMCLVQVEKMPKPVTACTTPVAEGMVVHTQTETVTALRKGVLEFLLINHPLDCPVCDKGGECDLQDLTFKYGPSTSRLIDGKVRRDKAVNLGSFIVLDEERCILCRRCTRFDDEVSREGNLIIAQRGHENVVTTTAGQPFDSYFSGNTIELCPVGALTSDLYRFRARPWDLAREPSVCAGCSVGCSVRLDFRHGRLLRVIAGDNPATDGGWICDRGRFNYDYVNGSDRLKQPLLRRGDVFEPVPWRDALMEAARRLRLVIADHGGAAVGLIGGGRLTNEEAYAFQKLARAVIGTPHVDHRAGAQVVASWAEFPGLMSDVDDATALLVVDVLPAERAPVLDLRVRRALERRGARLAAIGAALPRYRGRHARVQVRPGGTAAALRAAAAALAGEEAQAGTPYDEQATRLAELLSGQRKVVAIWGGEDPAAGEALFGLLRGLRARGVAAHLLVLGEQANSRGAEAMGARPDLLPGYRPVGDRAARAVAEGTWRVKLPAGPGMSSGEMLAAAAAGKLQALYVAGGNPALTFPDGALVGQALARVPLLIVQDLFLTETARQADIVLPAAPFPAKFGTYTALDGRLQEVSAAMEPGGDSQPDLVIFDALAAALGCGLVRSEAELRKEIRTLTGFQAFGSELAGAAGATPAAAAHLPGAPAGALRSHLPAGGSVRDAQEAGDGLLVVPVDRLHAGGGTAWHDPAFRRAHPRPAAMLHPADAAPLGLADGDDAELVGAGGASLRMAVRLDRAVAPGTVQVIRGLPGAPANRLLRGDRPAWALVRPVTPTLAAAGAARGAS